MSTRKLTQGLLLVALALSFTAVHIPLAAQEPRAAQFGDPPIAELISISEPNENGVVVIRGNQGAVFPGAVVEVRNLYTGDTAYTRAELTGVFAAEIYGPGNTPFWISPATNIDASERFRPGSLHGGPGVILYGPLPESYPPPPEAPPEVAAQPQTPIRIDGDSGEWAGQVEPMAVELEGQGALFYALANRESLYLALAPQEGAQPLPDDYSRLEIDLEIDERLFSVALDPRRGGGGRAYEHLSGPDADLGPLGGVSAQGAAIEVRVPRLAFTGAPAPLTLWALRFIRGEEEAAAPTVELSLWVEEVDAIDSRRVEPLPMGEEAVPFTLSGPVGGGSGRWQAVGRVNGLQFEAGDRLLLELQVSMQAPEMPGSGEDLRLGAALRLEPVVGASGAQTVADRATGNGWSGLLTPTGLPIENVAGGIALGEAGAQNLVIQEGGLSFLLQWQVSLEEGLPPGLYVPVIDGFVAVTGLYGAWGEAGILGNGPGAGIAEARLPVVLRVRGGPGGGGGSAGGGAGGGGGGGGAGREPAAVDAAARPSLAGQPGDSGGGGRGARGALQPGGLPGGAHHPAARGPGQRGADPLSAGAVPAGAAGQQLYRIGRAAGAVRLPGGGAAGAGDDAGRGGGRPGGRATGAEPALQPGAGGGRAVRAERAGGHVPADHARSPVYGVHLPAGGPPRDRDAGDGPRCVGERLHRRGDV